MDSQHYQQAWPHLKAEDLVACHFCDALHDAPELESGESAVCSNCGLLLYENRPNSLSRVTSYSIAALIFTLLVHSFPILTMAVMGNQTALTFWEAMRVLVQYNELLLAGLIFFFTILAPLLLTGGLLYIVAPLKVGKMLPGAVRLNVWIQRVEPWAMLEVFLLGFIVSLLKLGHLAELHFGVGLWALVALVVCISAALGAADYRELWDRLEILKFAEVKRRKKEVIQNKKDKQNVVNMGEETV